ncbi:SusC/RagA family TonB-linked outer membrane protein, partial [Zobellia sp.]|nr:SusC/RagA family TonB-linked outer membrane protein [Zobellia sp.]
IGLDLGLFDNRFTFTADYYDSKTEALLLEVPIPTVTGFESALQNLGRIRNNGVELSAGARNYGEKFHWDANFNITFNNNEILELGPEGDPIRSGSGAGNLFLNEIGGELGAFNVYRQIGIFQTEEEIANSPVWEGVPTFPGDVKYKDVDGDGQITTEDREVIGSGNPDFTWGFTSNLAYSNWDLNIVVNGVSGNLVSNIAQRFVTNLEGNQNQRAVVLGRWVSPEQPGNGLIPRANRTTSGNNNLSETDRWIEDGSFTRIQNVTLGYNIPSKFANKIGLSTCRFTLTGSNLAYFTKYSGYNPEVSFSGSNALNAGADYGSYPLARRFTFGMQIGF